MPTSTNANDIYRQGGDKISPALFLFYPKNNYICKLNYTKMDIPKSVEQAATYRLNLGGALNYVGKYKDREVYTVIFDKPLIIGLPELYLWDNEIEKVETVDGDKALDIISALF